MARVSGDTTAKINIFLYGTQFNTAMRNSPMPPASRQGEIASAPLALILKYLITSYGAGDNDISGQQLMGEAMSFLHNHPLLGHDDILGVTPDSNLQDQIERVRITPDALSLDDMSKLWSSFQSAEYRLSTGYEVSVVLIESTRPQRSPLPVLRRGANDEGPIVIAGKLQRLYGVRYPQQQASAELGDLITLLGRNLSSQDTVLRLTHPQLSSPIVIAPEVTTISSDEMELQLTTLADDPSLGFNWPAGFYSATLVTQPAAMPARKSNDIALQIAPQIQSRSPASAPAGDVVMSIDCLPQVREGQQAQLLFGSQAISPDAVVTPADPALPSTLTFTVVAAAASPNPYTLRLRVDGVDSIPVDFSGGTPQFSSAQQVTIT
jgi:hypothetical protein